MAFTVVFVVPAPRIHGGEAGKRAGMRRSGMRIGTGPRPVWNEVHIASISAAVKG